MFLLFFIFLTMTVNKLRILLVPLSRHSWVLHATSHSSLSLQNMSRNSENIEQNNIPIEVNQIPILNRMFKSQDSYFYKYLQSTINSGHVFWMECKKESENNPQSMKGRIFLMVDNVLKRINGYELFFGNVSSLAKDHKMFEYYFPCNRNQDSVSHLLNISRIRKKYHRNWFILSICAIPFTSLMGILPGPNVFLYWNCFRCYSHYKAMKGAEFVQTLMIDEKYQCVENECLTNLYQKFRVKNELEDNEQIMCISDEDMHGLQQEFKCSFIVQHLRRIQYQVSRLKTTDCIYALLCDTPD